MLTASSGFRNRNSNIPKINHFPLLSSSCLRGCFGSTLPFPVVPAYSTNAVPSTPLDGSPFLDQHPEEERNATRRTKPKIFLPCAGVIYSGRNVPCSPKERFSRVWYTKTWISHPKPLVIGSPCGLIIFIVIILLSPL